MGKVAWLLVIVVVVVVAVYVFPDLLNVPDLPEGEVEQFVRLDVKLKETGEWSDGLSAYAGNVTYFVYNLGNVNATNVHVTLSVGEVDCEDFYVPSIASGGYFSDDFSVSVADDESKEVELAASCGDSADSETFSVRAAFGRASFNSQNARLYVTPDDPLVLATLANITSSDLVPDWMEIRDWVSKNVDYAFDSDVHGAVEYWQFPNETLALGTGDCEDFSILLCSLLRANGWDENEAYVVIGAKDGQYHGWLQLDVDLIGWQSIEPQAGAWNTLVGDSLSLSGYAAEYMFNDVYFETQ